MKKAQNLPKATVDNLWTDAKGFRGQYYALPMGERVKVSGTMISILDFYMDAIETICEVAETSTPEQVQNYLNQFNLQYLFEYDNLVEEFYSELVTEY